MYPSAQSIILVPRTSRRVRRRRREAIVVPDDLPVFVVPPISTDVVTWNTGPFRVSPRLSLSWGVLIVLRF